MGVCVSSLNTPFRFSKPSSYRNISVDNRACVECGGSGFRSSEDGTTSLECERCVRAWFDRKLVDSGLGDLAEVEPVFAPQFIHSVQSNLWITASWRDLLPLLKGTVYAQWRATRATDKRLAFSVASDNDVLTAKFAGSDKYNKHPEDVPDLISPRLLVLRLGFLGYKNDAGAGYTLALLMDRRKRRRATWVTDTPAHPFVGPSEDDPKKKVKHLTWSPELETFLADYTRVQ